MTYRATFILNYNGLLFMDRGAWQSTVHRVAKSQTWLRDFTFTFSSETTNTIRQWNNVLNTQKENMCVCVCVLVTQLCPTLETSSGSSVHGILQARILKWVSIPFSRGSSQPRGWTWVSGLAGGFFTVWANWRNMIKNKWFLKLN